MDDQLIKDLITPIDDVATSTPEENLGTALSLINSSNDAVFVIDEKDNFLGLISPIYTIYKKRNPYTTKIQSVLLHPPFLTEDSKIKDVLSDMANLRIFELPVFEKGTKKKRAVGIISLKDILRAFHNQVIGIDGQIRIDKVYEINERARVEDVYSNFRSLKVYDMAVVDDLGKLVGLVSRKDVQESYIRPSNRQRFNKDAEIRADNISFDVEQNYRWKEKVRKYESGMVFTLDSNLDKKLMLKFLINSKFNDAIVIDDASRPVGILTTESILKGIMENLEVANFEIKFEKPKQISQNLIDEATDILKVFGERMSKRNPLQRIEVNFNEPKYSNGKTVFYQAHIVALFAHGKTYFAYSKRKGFLVSLRGAISEIKKQVQREKDQLAHHIEATAP